MRLCSRRLLLMRLYCTWLLLIEAVLYEVAVNEAPLYMWLLLYSM